MEQKPGAGRAILSPRVHGDGHRWWVGEEDSAGGKDCRNEAFVGSLWATHRRRRCRGGLLGAASVRRTPRIPATLRTPINPSVVFGVHGDHTTGPPVWEWPPGGVWEWCWRRRLRGQVHEHRPGLQTLDSRIGTKYPRSSPAK